MKIFIGADHNGFDLKHKLEEYLIEMGHEVIDEGGVRHDPNDDFTTFAARTVRAMLSSDYPDPRGILVCGSGQGMLIAANRFKGIRAGLGWSVEAAESIRNDEDSNVLALPSELFKNDRQWQEIVDIWLKTPFAKAARYIRRNAQLDAL